MGLPNAKFRVRKKAGQYNLTWEDNIDAANYTLNELTRAALRDSAKYIRRMVGEELKAFYSKTYVGWQHKKKIQANRTGKLITKYPMYACEYWVRKKEADLQIGFKQDSWYGMQQELGDKGQPKLGYLRSATYSSIGTIQGIQSKYLSKMNNGKPFDPGSGEYKSGGGLD